MINYYSRGGGLCALDRNSKIITNAITVPVANNLLAIVLFCVVTLSESSLSPCSDPFLHYY